MFASTSPDVKRYRDLGVSLIAAGTDLPLLTRATSALAEACRQA